MVLNPTLSEQYDNVVSVTSDEPFEIKELKYLNIYKETPEQYRARTESMTKRSIKKETTEERESRIAYMKQKSIIKAQNISGKNLVNLIRGMENLTKKAYRIRKTFKAY